MCVRAIRIFLCSAKACLPLRLAVCSPKVTGDPNPAMTVLCGAHATTSPPIFGRVDLETVLCEFLLQCCLDPLQMVSILAPQISVVEEGAPGSRRRWSPFLVRWVSGNDRTKEVWGGP